MQPPAVSNKAAANASQLGKMKNVDAAYGNQAAAASAKPAA